MFLTLYKDFQQYVTKISKHFYKKIKEKVSKLRESETRRKEKKKNSESKNISVLQSKEEKEFIDDRTTNSMKYMQILFYYVQDAVLFKISIPGSSHQDGDTMEKILSFSPEIVTLAYTEIMNACFIYAASHVSKVLFQMLFGFYYMLLLLVFFLIQKLLLKLLSKFSTVWTKVRSCLAQAFILGLLFSYQNLVKGAFTLVRCVSVENKKVLYIQGDKECYTWWQYLILSYIPLNIIPVFLILAIFPFHIRGKKISTKVFIAACLFPSPFLLHEIMARVREKVKSAFTKKKMQKSKSLSCIELQSLDIEGQNTMKQLDAFTGPENVEIPFIDEGSEDEVSPDMDLTSEISDDLTIHDVKVVAYSKSEKVLIDNLLQHYRELKLFGVRFTWLCIHKLYRVTRVCLMN